MKKFYFPLICVVLAVMAFTSVRSVFDDLEINEDKANKMTIESFGRGLVFSSGDVVRKARSLPVEMQVQGTRELIRYAKKYVQTEDFKKKYSKWRNEELGYKPKKGIGNPLKMLDNVVDKQLNKGDDESRMPSDPNELVRKRLQEFLKVSETVDFDAELQGTSFAKPSYEAKSQQWKACFRAGKEVVAAAREEAQAWLKELE